MKINILAFVKITFLIFLSENLLIRTAFSSANILLLEKKFLLAY